MKRPELLVRAGGGDSTAKSRETFPERFWAKVDKRGECWLWTGAKNKEGYGQIRLGPAGSTPLKAHRAAAVLAGDEIPENVLAHHHCGHRACVRWHPKHVRPATSVENSARRYRALAGEQLELVPA